MNEETERKAVGPESLDVDRDGEMASLENLYNPHTAGDGMVAKVWELLRRNPALRATAAELQNLSSTQQRQRLKAKFQDIDQQNPLAGLTLRWLFRPGLVRFTFPRQPEDFGRPWTIQDSVVTGYPDLTDESLAELEELISAEIKERTYPGPLSITNGPFTFNTPWPETPELFRYLFHRICVEYEVGKTNGPYQPWEEYEWQGNLPKIEINWGFLDSMSPSLDPKARYELERLRRFLERSYVFAIPRIIMTREHEKWIKKSLVEALEKLRTENKQFIDIRHYPGFLGNANAWLIFSRCYQRISYLGNLENPRQPFQRTGFGKARENLIIEQRNAGKWKTGKWEAHVTQDYSEMESLMFATFPQFDFPGLLRLSLGIDVSDAVLAASALALSGATEKLRALHCFH